MKCEKRNLEWELRHTALPCRQPLVLFLFRAETRGEVKPPPLLPLLQEKKEIGNCFGKLQIVSAIETNQKKSLMPGTDKA